MLPNREELLQECAESVVEMGKDIADAMQLMDEHKFDQLSDQLLTISVRAQGLAIGATYLDAMDN